MNKNIVIRQIQVKDVMTKSNAPIGGYCVNPYVGCTHGCKYCYANKNPQKAIENFQYCNPDSPILLGEIKDTDIIIPGNQKSLLKSDPNQISLFE